MSPVPCGPQYLTSSWLTEAMRHTTPAGTRISDLTWDIIGEEWGFTGVVARVYLQSLPDVGGPDSLVAKFPTAAREAPSHYQQRQALDEASQLRSYERSAREVIFYHEIVPRGHVPAPRLYFGAADADSHCVVLLLEDLGHGTTGDVLQGCSPTQADMILQAIAPFHTLWWQDRQLDVLSWLPRWGRDIPSRALRYAKSVEPFLARFGGRLPNEY